MKCYKKIILILLFLTGTLYSQGIQSDSLSSFDFKWSNDFEYQTDYYFTNGFEFELVTPWAKANPVNAIFLIPSTESEVLYSTTLLQHIFTPKEKRNIPEQQRGDRPFAAYILLGAKKISFNKIKRQKFSTEFQIGILGPAALGEEVQNGIHSLLPTSDDVIGWENQISNSFMVNYTASIEKIFSIKSWLEVSGIVAAKLGLPYTNAKVGIKSRIGIFDLYPKGFEFLSSQKLKLYLSLSAEGSFVGYNATLQGGVFSESVYTLNRINRFVGYANIGVTMIYKSLELEYAQQFNTPEFPEAVYHSWGYLLIKVKL